MVQKIAGPDALLRIAFGCHLLGETEECDAALGRAENADAAVAREALRGLFVETLAEELGDADEAALLWHESVQQALRATGLSADAFSHVLRCIAQQAEKQHHPAASVMAADAAELPNPDSHTFNARGAREALADLAELTATFDDLADFAAW